VTCGARMGYFRVLEAPSSLEAFDPMTVRFGKVVETESTTVVT